MKYKGKELVEITTPQIFVQPKEMLVWNADYVPQHVTVYAIVKVENHYVAVTNGRNWEHCAEIPEEPKSRRVTNRELSKWLAKGHGEYTNTQCSKCAASSYSTYAYLFDSEESEVGYNILVRKWDDVDWHEPTVDYMGIE